MSDAPPTRPGQHGQPSAGELFRLKETASYYSAAIYTNLTQAHLLDPVEALEGAVELAEFANRELLATIREAHADGLSLRAIAAVTGDSPETVRKIIRAG